MAKNSNGGGFLGCLIFVLLWGVSPACPPLLIIMMLLTGLMALFVGVAILVAVVRVAWEGSWRR